MDFGMPTLIELETLGSTTDLCKELGLNFIELNMNLPQYQLHSVQASHLCRLQTKQLYFTLHLDENINVWDFNPLVAKAYLDTVIGAIELAKASNISIINMHLHNGVSFTMPTERVYLYEQYKSWFMEKTRSLKDACERAAEGSEVKICIENCRGFTGFQLDALAYLLQSDVFGLTFDVGHNHAAGLVDEPFIMENLHKLHHVHLHDATSTRNHMVLGTGDVDIYRKMDLAAKHNCRCVVETKTIQGLRESAAFLRKRGLLS